MEVWQEQGPEVNFCGIQRRHDGALRSVVFR